MRMVSTTDVRWALAEHARDPGVFDDLFVLLAWLECVSTSNFHNQPLVKLRDPGKLDRAVRTRGSGIEASPTN